MAQPVSNVKIIASMKRGYQRFRVHAGFTTVVGAMLDVHTFGGENQSETYTCSVGPHLKKDEFGGASCLPSIGGLEPTTTESVQCVLESWDAEWNDVSGLVELRITVSAAGGPGKLQILFSVTIMAAD